MAHALFTADAVETYTAEALEWSESFTAVLNFYMELLRHEDLSVREISHMMHQMVIDCESRKGSLGASTRSIWPSIDLYVAIEWFMQQMHAAGFVLWEISHLMLLSVIDCELETLLALRTDLKKGNPTV